MHERSGYLERNPLQFNTFSQYIVHVASRIKPWIGGKDVCLVGMSGLRFMASVYVLALVPRLCFVLLVGRADLSLDEIEYHMLAANVVEGKGYCWFFGLPSAFRPPGYPFLLAALYYVIGPHYFAARIVQSFVAATMPVLCYLLGKETFGERPARLGALCAAFYPALVVHSAALLTENVFIPLLLLALWLLVRAKEGDKTAQVWPPAIALALAVLVRPSLTFFIPVVLFWLFWNAPSRRSGLARCGIILGVWLVAVAPWCFRNYQVTERFVYLDTRMGYNLYVGYRDDADGSFDMDAAKELTDAFIEVNLPKLLPNLKGRLSKRAIEKRISREVLSYKLPGFPNHDPREMYDLSAAESDVVMSDWGTQRALEFMGRRPGRALALVPLKFMSFWNLEHRLFIYAYSQDFLGPLPKPLLALLLFILVAPFAALTLLGLFGATHPQGSEKNRFLLFGLIAYFSLLHSLVFGEARFHYVLIPILALFAASGLLGIRLLVSKRGIHPSDGVHARWRTLLFVTAATGLTGIWIFGLYQALERIGTIFGPLGHQSRLLF
jgi:4-amino-4-deoxy-L-arabinose transferase-like glycosyltransferase